MSAEIARSYPNVPIVILTDSDGAGVSITAAIKYGSPQSQYQRSVVSIPRAMCFYPPMGDIHEHGLTNRVVKLHKDDILRVNNVRERLEKLDNPDPDLKTHCESMSRTGEGYSLSMYFSNTRAMTMLADGIAKRCADYWSQPTPPEHAIDVPYLPTATRDNEWGLPPIKAEAIEGVAGGRRITTELVPGQEIRVAFSPLESTANVTFFDLDEPIKVPIRDVVQKLKELEASHILGDFQEIVHSAMTVARMSKSATTLEELIGMTKYMGTLEEELRLFHTGNPDYRIAETILAWRYIIETAMGIRAAQPVAPLPRPPTSVSHSASPLYRRPKPRPRGPPRSSCITCINRKRKCDKQRPIAQASSETIRHGQGDTN
ncbi:hypothetical protein RSOL_333870, partial [Rhizoctonia solani AG-3 Rhs1AP]